MQDFPTNDVVTEVNSGPSGALLVPGIILALGGALIGGLVWAGIAIVTDFELAIVAMLVGVLAGGGALLGSAKRGGIPYQIIAAVASVVGIFAGKYISIYHFYSQEVISQVGQEIWDAVGEPLLSSEYLQIFMDALPELLEILDFVFFGLAIFIAFGIPKRRDPVLRMEDPGWGMVEPEKPKVDE